MGFFQDLGLQTVDTSREDIDEVHLADDFWTSSIVAMESSSHQCIGGPARCADAATDEVRVSRVLCKAVDSEVLADWFDWDMRVAELSCVLGDIWCGMIIGVEYYDHGFGWMNNVSFVLGVFENYIQQVLNILRIVCQQQHIISACGGGSAVWADSGADLGLGEHVEQVVDHGFIVIGGPWTTLACVGDTYSNREITNHIFSYTPVVLVYSFFSSESCHTVSKAFLTSSAAA